MQQSLKQAYDYWQDETNHQVKPHVKSFNSPSCMPMCLLSSEGGKELESAIKRRSEYNCHDACGLSKKKKKKETKKRGGFCKMIILSIRHEKKIGYRYVPNEIPSAQKEKFIR